MITYFKKGPGAITAVETNHKLTEDEIQRLVWLFDDATPLASGRLKGTFIGPRREMVSPWSTNAVEIARNMGLDGISRIEQFVKVKPHAEPEYDAMLQAAYNGLDQKIFNLDTVAAPIRYVEDIHAYNLEEGLALSADEEEYLKGLSQRLGRPLTDSEVFGFSQVNSEHCRHKIFNGEFEIDGEVKPGSLFKMIKETSRRNPGRLVSAYKDNVAFVKGPRIEAFYPEEADRPSRYTTREADTVISLKAETHNFPTTVEPFNGAATGSGGEIRDRLGGGKASLPLAGTAVYMTSYPRIRPLMKHEATVAPRKWLYQTPAGILIKASNGASDFGNKFGQPLICGSVLTFEHEEAKRIHAYDKVIMLAGGVGYAFADDAIKGVPEPGQAVVVMGGDNYRIGMGGGAVSSVATGRYSNAIELNAVQRANPEMQKRVANVIRSLAESGCNPIVSIHDHGAGGHLNALSELLEATGGHINMAALPVGDPTLSAKEIIGNESQERMGFVIAEKDLERVRRIAERERAPMYVVGHTTDDHRFVVEQADGEKPIDLEIADMMGSTPKTRMVDKTVKHVYADPEYDVNNLQQLIADTLRLEAVGCKDWLTNKVDRSVTGRVARQQCQGPLQLPLSDCGVVALDYKGEAGIATSLGHAPQAALIDSAEGSRLAIAEALTNIVGAPLHGGLDAISLSANWMWPCRNEGEDAALWNAVEACSKFAIDLGINIPTGKDSLSMTQRYGDTSVMAPGTVIISAAGEVTNVKLTSDPVARDYRRSKLVYVPFSDGRFELGGSAFAQSLGKVGSHLPRVADAATFRQNFNALQEMVASDTVMAMHDVGAGGLVTTLLEMVFSTTDGGIAISSDKFAEPDVVKILLSENPGVVVQLSDSDVAKLLGMAKGAFVLGEFTQGRSLTVEHAGRWFNLDIDSLREAWREPSNRLEPLQTNPACAAKRARNYAKQPLRFKLPKTFDGKIPMAPAVRPKAAILREKGVNSEREMAYSLWLAGFEVRDVHMTDLTSGRETLDDINMIVFCGGFSNSDVAGSAKGWAGAIKYNPTAWATIRRFYERKDTLSLGICNGCQLMMELNLIDIDGPRIAKMAHNESGKFESCFVSVVIPQNNTVMLGNLAGYETGIWVAHGEGRFVPTENWNENAVALRYSYRTYPGNPNGSRGAVAAVASADGRHLAMMPHPERSIFPWQCGAYPSLRRDEESTLWMNAFVNARLWVETHCSSMR